MGGRDGCCGKPGASPEHHHRPDEEEEEADDQRTQPVAIVEEDSETDHEERDQDEKADSEKGDADHQHDARLGHSADPFSHLGFGERYLLLDQCAGVLGQSSEKKT